MVDIYIVKLLLSCDLSPKKSSNFKQRAKTDQATEKSFGPLPPLSFESVTLDQKVYF